MNESESRVPIFSWIFTFIVLAIPLVNIIYCIVLVFGGSKYESKISFFRALLIISLIGAVVGCVISVLALGGFSQFKEVVVDFLKQIIDYINSIKDNIVVVG